MTPPARRHRRKNVAAMTLAEFNDHVRRFGGRLALVRALGCARDTVRDWGAGRINIPARWADRIRALPTPPPPTRKRRGPPSPYAPRRDVEPANEETS